ncbi:MAG: hypothetical protein AAGG65_18985 [Pseudomonadota bacterium]
MKRVLLASIAAVAISAPAMAQDLGGGAGGGVGTIGGGLGAGGDFTLDIGGLAGTGSVTGGFGSATSFNGASGFSGSVSSTRAGAQNPTLGNTGTNAAFAAGSSDFGFAGVGASSVNFGSDCGCTEPGDFDAVSGGVDTAAGSATTGFNDSASFSGNTGNSFAENNAGGAYDFANGAAADGFFANVEFNEFGVIGGVFTADGGFGLGIGGGTDGGGGGGFGGGSDDGEAPEPPPAP